MPLVDVTYDSGVTEDDLGRLRQLLPDLVAQAVNCAEEPWSGPAEAGDIEIRFRAKSPYDVGELRVVVEVHSRRLASRVDDAQQRADLIGDGLSRVGLDPVGVWLILSDGAWSQT